MEAFLRPQVSSSTSYRISSFEVDLFVTAVKYNDCYALYVVLFVIIIAHFVKHGPLCE